VSMLPKPKRQHEANRVTMIGLDFGSTTSSAMVATAVVGLSSATGRMDLDTPRVIYRSDPVLTPFIDEKIDSDRLNSHINRWISESDMDGKRFFAGGVIITGLAASKSNAPEIAKLIGERIGETVIATADDPCLESWLAFMGSCSTLSRCHPETPFINLDIGGGTTNPAFGASGDVFRTGCYFIGARHFQFDPGTYRLTGMSPYGRELLENLGIKRTPGQEFAPGEVNAVLNFYIAALEAIAVGNLGFFSSPAAALYQQAAFVLESYTTDPVIVFSGGVGELVYRESQGLALPGTTYYGDLGIDLARRITQSSVLARHLQDCVPENQGRATVYGLTLHSTEISGQTIFISAQDVLPLRNLPIVARLAIDADLHAIEKAVSLLKATVNGGCIQVLPRACGKNTECKGQDSSVCHSREQVKSFGERLRLSCTRLQPGIPVVVLVSDNCGQVLGNYASRWRRESFSLIVIDEIPDRLAHFVNIGRLHNAIVPVSFYGVC
jgi:ethanolamine utilization protein EutA